MQEGWIKLYRSSFENRLYFDEPFTRFQAWIDLLLLANHKDGSFFKRGNIVKVPRGTVARSMKELADRWQWSEAKVSRFINFLESEYIKQVKAQKSNVTTLITILNYDRYQTNEGAELRTNVRTNDAQTTTYKNVKNKKEEKNIGDTKGDGLISKIPQSQGGLIKGAWQPQTPPDVILPELRFEASEFSEIPDDMANRLVKAILITKEVETNKEELETLWDLFKTTELSKKTYVSKDAVYGHFFNWAKRIFLKNTKKPKKAESKLRPFTGEIRGLKFSEDFTFCEMEDGSTVKLEANKRDMAESGMISPKDIIKTDKK